MNLFETFSAHIGTQRWLRHLLFWFGVFLFILTTLTLQSDMSVGDNIIWFVIKLIPTAFVSYFLAYYWMPQLFQKKKYLLAILSFLVVAYISSAFFRYITIYVGEPLTVTAPFSQEPVIEILTDFKMLITRYFVSIYFIAFAFLFAKYFGQYTKVKEDQLTIKKLKAEEELKALKAQLNPHFLFNTLNNIYSLSIDNSPETPESIGKLSEILDYLLYRCNEKYVPIRGEIELLKNYIDLEKLRYDDRLKVDFIDSINTDVMIAPHIMLSLVENAFKHGAGEDSGSPQIDLSLTQKDGIVIFEISNSISKEEEESSRESIGLENIKKQLDLLYPDSYSLNIQEEQSTFKVLLEINTLGTE